MVPGAESRILEVAFRLLRPVADGEQRPVASWIVPGGMRLEERLLQVSGRIGGGEAGLPVEVIVRAEIRDLESGALVETFRVIVGRSVENGFRKAKKLPKSIAVDGLVTVTLEPVGSGLPRGTQVGLCLDLVRKRNDLGAFSSCAAGGAATTLSGIQSSIFSPRCATGGCHDAESAQQGLVLEPGRSYERLVNVNAMQLPSERRVRPGDSERSYLIKKLRGAAPIGGRMPLGGPYLTQSELAGIAEWIDNGAADN